MTLNDSIQAFRLRVLAEAQRSGNVSASCRRYGVSRTQFYRWRQRLERYGPEGVHPKRRVARPGRPPQVSVVAERRVVAEALAWPTRGPQWVRARLAREGLEVTPTTVWRVWHRHGLGTRRERLAALEPQSAVQVGLLTKRTKPRRVSRHVAADHPGDLCSLDTFDIGKLKGVGKVWQRTACDAASSYGWARVVAGEVTAAVMAAFLVAVVVPGYEAAGWCLRRVLTDNGKEFQGAFGATCAARHVRHTRTKPRHAWTNGFVGRLQGTILHEHWRVAFRRQHVTRLRQLQRSLDGFLRFSKTQRPHQSSRLRGQTPITRCAGAVAA
jgi:transposase-like protein